MITVAGSIGRAQRGFRTQNGDHEQGGSWPSRTDSPHPHEVDHDGSGHLNRFDRTKPS
jgi:hypothetical protein